MSVIDASDELFHRLRGTEGVVGSGVGKKNNAEYIIIYLSEATQNILSKIPREFKGKRVETETTGKFSFH